VTGTERWRENWSVLGPPGAVQVDLPRSPAARRALVRDVRSLPAGSAVVLRDGVLASRWRCRRFAARAGVQVERQYVALPSVRSPAFLVEDGRRPLGYFCSAVLSVPPGVALLAAPVGLLSRAAAWLARAGLVGAIAPGRVAIGWRR
jgi:hypothetical protein